jgi:hypothetical protein
LVGSQIQGGGGGISDSTDAHLAGSDNLWN